MSVPGGGSLPGATVPSWGLTVIGDIAPDELHARLRRSTPPVVARIAEDRVILDLRAVFPDQDELVENALVAALET
jgi:L-seryl-tRNA(Ser) seleniumtransferase